MSYTAPAYNAADLTFESGYTTPAYDEADFSFLTANIATGFSSTQFGTPVASVDHTGQATGFSSTQFGTPFAVYDFADSATGFSSTQFGTPESTRQEQVTGFSSTQFGTPYNQPWAVGFSSTQFGTPIMHRLEYQITQDSTFIPGDPQDILVTGNPNVWNTYPFDQIVTVSGDYGDVDVQTIESTSFGYLSSLVTQDNHAFVQPGDSYEFELALQRVPASGLPTSDTILTTFSISAYSAIDNYDVDYYAQVTRSSGGDVSVTLAAYAEDDEYDILLDETTTQTVTGFPTSFSLYEGPTFRMVASPAEMALYIRAPGFAEVLAATLPTAYTPVAPVSAVWVGSYYFKVSSISLVNTDDSPTIEVSNRTIYSRHGNHTGRHWWRAAGIGLVTRFGTPTTPHDVTETATGFRTGGVGRPVLFPGSLPDHEYVSADGFRSTQFGMPAAVRDETGEATGRSSTNFGTPATTVTTQAQGTTTTQFGTPVAANRASASGFRSTQFGAATSTRTERAAGFSKTRVGKPRAYDIGGHRAYGFRCTKFGHPRGRDSIGGTATGLHGTQFGTPAAVETHLVDPLPPVTSFGKPTLIRQPLC